MKRLIAFGCGVAMIIVALKQPWLNAHTLMDVVSMHGDGKWFIGLKPDTKTAGWQLQWPAMIGGAFCIVGSLTHRTYSYAMRVIIGAVIAGVTALVAMLATEKVSGIPQTELLGVVLHVDSAPKVLLLLAVVAAAVGLTTQVPVNDAETAQSTARPAPGGT